MARYLAIDHAVRCMTPWPPNTMLHPSALSRSLLKLLRDPTSSSWPYDILSSGNTDPGAASFDRQQPRRGCLLGQEHPVRWMRELLPPDVAILGSHPMFGPDSAAESLQGRK